MSTALLTDDAEHLFNLCAFFSPEPIAGELLLENADAVSDPPGLRELLSSSPRFRAAASQMHRLSLVKVDGARDQIQMHRVVQAVTRGQLRQHRPDAFLAYRAAADTLLAESNPGNPDRDANDAVYDLSLQHLESDRSFLQHHQSGAAPPDHRPGTEAAPAWQPRRGDAVRAGGPPGVAGSAWPRRPARC